MLQRLVALRRIGRMQPDRALYDVASLRALEKRAAQALGDDFVLMRRAGEAAWRDLLGWWPAARRVVVVCGPGNNGGDGYLLAAHAARSGRAVHVVCFGAPRSRFENARRPSNRGSPARGSR